MIQKLRFTVLTMNLWLETSCIQRIITNLDFLFLCRFRTTLVLFFDFKLFGETFVDSQVYNGFSRHVNRWIFTVLRNLVRVSQFWTGLVRNLMDSHWFGFVVIDKYEEVSFWLLPVFYSEISNWNFKNFFESRSVCWFLALNPKINR